MYVWVYSIGTKCYLRERPMYVWGRSSPVRSLMQLSTTQRMSPVLEQSFDMQNIHIPVQPEVLSYVCKYAQMAYLKETMMHV